jgi:hypothetical protein
MTVLKMRALMNKEQVERLFKQECMPVVCKMREQSGRLDLPARREAWNNYVAFLINDNRISTRAAQWVQPKWLETMPPLKIVEKDSSE